MMEHEACGMQGGAEPYDFRKYDRIWQRVAPSLSPYPPGHMNGDAPAGGESAAYPMPRGMEESGAQQNPCCLGSVAMESLGVLEGFIEETLADQRHYLAFARQAPNHARPVLRQLAVEEGDHARRLMAVYYLITGKCYQPHVSCDRVYIGAYCPALRERYHAEVCGGFNYARAADGTTDPCLIKLWKELSESEYRHAGMVMSLLEKALGRC